MGQCRAIAAIFAAVVALQLMTPAAAQNYPNRSIRSICNFGPGSGADIVVRYFSDQLAKLANVPVIVENKPGAQGSLATAAAASARPDGYTIMITPASSTLAAAPYLFKELPFDPVKDFRSVATLARLAFVFVVRPDHEAKSLADLTTSLRKKDGKGFFGASNNTGVIASELYRELAGLKLSPVSFRDASESLKALIAGELDFIATDSTWVAPMAKSGRIRALAVTSTQRNSSLPEVPTMHEAGFSAFDISPWWGVVVPAKTPDAVVERLGALLRKIAESPETAEFLQRFATDPMSGSPQDMENLLVREREAWKGYVALAKIEPQ